MSSPSTYNDQGTIAADATERQSLREHVYNQFAGSVVAPIRMIGFWSAVALPFLHVPLLATGLEGSQQTVTFLSLLALNLLALLVGYPHRQR
ncbi:hypothetical protein SAMN06269185_0896 [Natronoarchaeum philippinense]|uniref:Uncharacterized protein n=1 Tax=Natronoarchaeum philippinense TaxID=558529 RepID=A0A285N835_NATPI|nr:hypothetical protein [Natronoarchaeum philippinense]SNZ05580.1 hypothetical protein SAMN06269185_0896 [Natronoarchaeum philippinense]